jgi:hypothetical protein
MNFRALFEAESRRLAQEAAECQAGLRPWLEPPPIIVLSPAEYERIAPIFREEKPA